MALPLPPGLTQAEVAFVAEMEMVTVVPRQRLESIDLLAVGNRHSISPFAHCPRRLPPPHLSSFAKLQTQANKTFLRPGQNPDPTPSSPSRAAPLARPPAQEAAPRQHRAPALAASGLAARDHSARDERGSGSLFRAAPAAVARKPIPAGHGPPASRTLRHYTLPALCCLVHRRCARGVPAVPLA